MQAEPSPPGWYVDPYDDRRIRYWTGERWNDAAMPRSWPLPGPSTMGLLRGRSGNARWPIGARLRLLRAGALMLVVVGAPSAVAGLVSLALGRVGLTLAPSARNPLPWLAGLVLVAPLAPRASYRARDALLLLVPVVNVLWLGRVCWRLAFLPYRDWAPRPEQAPHWRQIINPDAPGNLLYVDSRLVRRNGRSRHSPS